MFTFIHFLGPSWHSYLRNEHSEMQHDFENKSKKCEISLFYHNCLA